MIESTFSLDTAHITLFVNSCLTELRNVLVTGSGTAFELFGSCFCWTVFIKFRNFVAHLNRKLRMCLNYYMYIPSFVRPSVRPF